MMARHEQAEALLSGLGFTALEAAVYRCLVEASPATGYRVAQQLGKPIANTYKAVESLAAKGAVLVDEGEHRQWRAVPPGELLRRLERAFHERCAAAEGELMRLAQPAADDRVYALRSRGQVIERARAMIDDAAGIVLIDAFPGPLEEVRASVEGAVSRGVRVGCLVYDDVGLAGVQKVRVAQAPWMAQWPGEQLMVVADGLQHLVAVLERGGAGVVQAVWSPSLILAMTQHDGLVSQLMAHSSGTLLASGADIERLRSERESLRTLSVIHSIGYMKLIEAKAEDNDSAGGGR